MRIEVTQEDIDRGKRGNSCECPVARAVKRAIGDGGVFVQHEHISTRTHYFRAPREVRNFITAFDYPIPGFTILPFAFDIPYEKVNGDLVEVRS